jgi:hypothetical protein
MSLNKLLAVFAIAFLGAQPALATVIIGANSVTTDFVAASDYGSSVGRLIDQSGLVPVPPPEYVSGSTLYSDFLFGPPPKTHAGILPENGFRAEGSQGTFAFSLAETYTLTNLALWSGVARFGINGFDLWISTNNDFASAINVGSFNAADTNPPQAQDFPFAETPGAFVWLNVTSGYSGGSIAIGEVAFGGMATTVVPEPASGGLLGLGLLGFGFRRSRLR